MEEQSQGHKLRDILTILFKHKWKVLISLGVFAAATVIVAYAFFAETFFVARGVLMVKMGREFYSVNEVGETKPAMSQEAVINAEKQIITSRDLVMKVVQDLGPTNLYPKLAKKEMPGATVQELGVQEFLQNVFVKDTKGSNLIEVYFRHENPYVAAKALNVLVESLRDKHLQVFSTPKSPFLEEQLKQYDERLKGAEKTLAEYKQKHNVVELQAQKDILLKQRSELEFALATEEGRVKELKTKRDFLRTQKDIVPEGVANELRTQLNTLLRREQEMQEKYTDGNKMMVNLRREIQLLRDQLQKQEDDVRKTEITRIDAELKPMEVKVANLQRQLAHVSGELRTLDARERAFHELRREVTTTEGNYLTYLKKLEEARISEDMDVRKMTNIVVVQQPSVPVQPMPSRKAKVLGGGLAASFALAIALAFVAEYLPQGLTTPTAAEKKLKLPVLTTIPLKKKAA